MDNSIRYIDTENELYAQAKKIRIDCFFENSNNAENLIQDEFEKNGTHLVFLRDNKVIGTGRIHTIDTVGIISQMAVKKEHQKTGIGTKLLIELITKCKSLGFKKIELSARETALEFYKKNGFETLGNQYPSVKTGIIHQKMRFIINNNNSDETEYMKSTQYLR